MKKQLLLASLILSGCGLQSRDNELIGQIKKIMHNTPLICPDYIDVDISLGVIRNGVGSMSTQDMWLMIKNDEQAAKLKSYADSGQLVRITYDVQRLTICIPDHQISKVEAAQ